MGDFKVGVTTPFGHPRVRFPDSLSSFIGVPEYFKLKYP
jgi:hypothetical protein